MSVVSASADVGLVFALGLEQASIESTTTHVERHETPDGKFRLCRLGERSLAAVVSGPGRGAAQRATETLIQAHRPRLVVSAGFAGGLSPDLKPADVVMARRIVRLAGPAVALEPTMLERFQVDGVAIGPFAEVEAIVAAAEAKRAWSERTEAVACDMESAAVAEVCIAHATPFLAIRAVTDAVDEDLPNDLAPLIEARGTARTLGAVVGSLWRRPASLKDMWNLHERAVVAAAALGRVLVQIIERL